MKVTVHKTTSTFTVTLPKIWPSWSIGFWLECDLICLPTAYYPTTNIAMPVNYFRITLFMISLVVMYVNFAPDNFPLIRNRRYISYTLPSVCTTDGRIAFTFDEGPTTYTAAVLDAL